MPKQLKINAGSPLTLPSTIVAKVADHPRWKQHLKIWGTHLNRLTRGQHQLATASTGQPATLTVDHDEQLADEEYTINITDRRLSVSAGSVKGLAHATATLLQLVGDTESKSLPQLSIYDTPTSCYRSLMIDMGRNPHSIELLRETIDLLWFYKLDSLHLHLTDDQRFAFPSAAFPRLWDGQITLDEFKALEEYALVRGVTIIPELDVPGHSTLLRRHYPETFGTTTTELATSKKALVGVETLLDEMAAVFSSPYIHIGGDEAFGITDSLQRHLVNQLHQHLKSKGRETLAWEGPRKGELDDRVNAEVIYLNWRTVNYPADQMIDAGHRVINAAWDPLYIVDHYPRTNFTLTSPEHIYRTLELRRFKHVNPKIITHATPVQTPASQQLIGFCMPWWEGRENNFLPIVVPRIIPFAEIAWIAPESRDFTAFEKRAEATEAMRQSAFYPIGIESPQAAVAADGVFHHRTQVVLTNRLSSTANNHHDDLASNNPTIRYTLDGSRPSQNSSVYSQPLVIDRTLQIRAALFVDNQSLGHDTRQQFTHVAPAANLALGSPVMSSATSGVPFSVQRVTDGGTGKLDFYLGYPATPKNPIHVTVDLQQPTRISRINVIAFSFNGSFEKHEVQVSQDGQQYTTVGSKLTKPIEDHDTNTTTEHKFEPRDVRYIRIESYGNHGYVFDSFSKIIEVQAFE